MRTIPSVTLTTVPTLRASVADLNLSMRALMRSLISDALMDITLNPLANTGHLRRQLERDAFEPAEQGTVDYRVAGTEDRAADQCGIRGAVQPHAALELALESLGERRLLGAVDRRSGRHCHVDDALRLVFVLIEQRGNFRQEPQAMVFRERAEEILAVFIERGAGNAHHELGQVLAADARAAEQFVHPWIAHRRGGGAQPLGPAPQILVGLRLLESCLGVGPRDGGLFSHPGPLDLRRELVDEIAVGARIDFALQDLRRRADGNLGNIPTQRLAGMRS